MKHVSIGLVLLALACASASGETIAVAVRPAVAHTDAGLLVGAAEQGAMDRFFSTGHIVFDLHHEAGEDLSAELVAEAAEGGAALLLVVEIVYRVAGSILVPESVAVVVVDTRSAEPLAEEEIHAAALGEEGSSAPETLAAHLGTAAADVVLRLIGGGGPAW